MGGEGRVEREGREAVAERVHSLVVEFVVSAAGRGGGGAGGGGGGRVKSEYRGGWMNAIMSLAGGDGMVWHCMAWHGRHGWHGWRHRKQGWLG